MADDRRANGNDGAGGDDGRAAAQKRPWVTPAIVATQAAFEHAILTCNGKPSGSPFCSAPRLPKGNCVTTSGCTANS